jgi:hypothetical protein
MPNPSNKKYLLLFCMKEQDNKIRGIPLQLFNSHEEALKFAEDNIDDDYAITDIDIDFNFNIIGGEELFLYTSSRK